MTAPPSTETPRHTATVAISDDNYKGAEEFCKGAFGPFVSDVSQYTAIVALAFQQVSNRSHASLTARVAELEAELAKSCDDMRFADSDAGCTRAVLADARVKRLEAALRQIKAKTEGDRPTVNPENAFGHWSNLNAVLVIIRGLASDALEAKP